MDVLCLGGPLHGAVTHADPLTGIVWACPPEITGTSTPDGWTVRQTIVVYDLHLTPVPDPHGSATGVSYVWVAAPTGTSPDPDQARMAWQALDLVDQAAVIERDLVPA